MIKGEKVMEVLKKRLKFYVLGYIMGLLGPLITQLKQDEYKFFPVNLLAILSAIGIGTAAYYGAIHMPLFAGTIRCLKYIIPIIIIVIIASYIEMYLIQNYNINIKPYIGF